VSAPSLLTDPYSTIHRAFTTAYTQARRSALGTIPITITDTATLDAVDRLALTLSELCSTAVDPLAIVAGLEAEGYSDRAAREQFGLPDLFVLADQLHKRVPREMSAPEARAPKPPADARILLRGLLFAAPALYGVTFLTMTSTSGATRAALAAVQILAWGYGQGIAHLAYARLGSGERDAARQVLRNGTIWALATAIGLFGLIELLFAAPARVTAPAASTLGFCLAAVPALVLGAEYALAAALLPAALAAASSLLGGSPMVAALGVAASATAATAVALRITRVRTAVVPLRRDEVRRAAPHVLSGLGTGALVTLVLAGPTAARGPAALHAAMVLTLAMGAGEWHARWYQRRVEALLAAIADPASFPRRATAFLALALVRQIASTAALAAVAFATLDRAQPDAAGLYLCAVALAPGLLAALFIRSRNATAVLWPTALTLLATAAAVPERNAAVVAALAAESAVWLAVRAAEATSRPWAHL
jgi:hypothetical protein